MSKQFSGKKRLDIKNDRELIFNTFDVRTIFLEKCLDIKNDREPILNTFDVQTIFGEKAS